MPYKLYKRGRFWHVTITAAGRRLRRSTKTTERKIAERIASEAETKEWRRHLDGPGADVTMAQAFLAYREAQKPTRFLEPLEDRWKDTPLNAVTPEAIRQSAVRLYPNAKPATRNRQVIAPTQAVYNHAARLAGIPEIKVSRFPVETKPKAAATAEWAREFAEAANRSELPHLAALCLFMFGTGARIGEATSLTWADIDFSRRTALINQTKVSDTREAHLPSALIGALTSIPSMRNPKDLVFGYADRHSVKQTWDKTIEKAGIERMTPHSCRHGFATTLLRGGHDVKTVARLGGWKDAATVLKHYAHAIEDRTLTEAIFGTNTSQTEHEERLIIKNTERKPQ